MCQCVCAPTEGRDAGWGRVGLLSRRGVWGVGRWVRRIWDNALHCEEYAPTSLVAYTGQSCAQGKLVPLHHSELRCASSMTIRLTFVLTNQITRACTSARKPISTRRRC